MGVISFKKFEPALELKPFVKFLYQISVNEKGQLFSSSTLNHPQGGIDLMFVTQGKVGFMSGSEVKGEESDIMLVGQQNRFFSFSFAPNTVLYGVVFYPIGAHRWLNLPISESMNTMRPLLKKEIVGDVQRLKGMLLECEEPGFAIQAFNNWLRENLKEQANTSVLLDKGLKHIHSTNTLPNVAEMAAMFNLSKRSLQRHFQRLYGISPKQYIDVLRFNRLMHELQVQGYPDLQLVTFLTGYYDQSHLIKVFRKMTGKTPSQFIKEKPPLAEYFLHL